MVRACLKIPILLAARSLRAGRDVTSECIGKEIREREATKPPPVKNRRRKIAIFRHALMFQPENLQFWAVESRAGFWDWSNGVGEGNHE